MSSLAALTRLLAVPAASGEVADAAASTRGLDDAIALLGLRASAGSQTREPIDLQQDAVHRYWQTGRLDSLRDARLVAFGLDLPAGPDGLRVLDDRARFEAVLALADGWRTNARAYRRCYQGLLRTYFAHDPAHDPADASVAPTAHANWKLLRTYLKARAPATRDPSANPDWVVSLARHADVFGDTPTAGFTERLLAGDRSELDAVCAQWGIAASSWFPRALVQAQVLATTQRSHDDFAALLPAALALLVEADPWRDTGLTLLLERQAQIPQAPLHAGLRDAVGAAWGCPWHASGSPQWERVGDAASGLAAHWLKADLIERFCARITDGSGPRRAAFWTRYTASIQILEFAEPRIESRAVVEAPVDEPRRANAATAPLRDGTGADAAMILTIGCVRLVTFADPAKALYGYDLRRTQRFDTTQPLAIDPDAPNSLCHAGADLRLFHRDEVDGWRQWEQSFEAALKDAFGLRFGSAPAAHRSAFVDLADGLIPDLPAPLDAAVPTAPHWLHTSAGEDVHWHTAEAASVPYSRPNLEVLARVHRLTLGTDSEHAGSATVSGAALDHRITTVLLRWGFVETSACLWRRTERKRLALAA